jgi:hypothetical protein
VRGLREGVISLSYPTRFIPVEIFDFESACIDKNNFLDYIYE